MDEWIRWAIGGAFFIITTLLGMLWKHNQSQHKQTADMFHRFDTEMRGFETYFASKDTVLRIEENWRDELKLLRMEQVKNYDLVRAERLENHRDNLHRFDKLEDSLGAIRELLDQVLLKGKDR